MLATQMQNIRAYVSLYHTDAREINLDDWCLCERYCFFNAGWDV